MKSERTDNIDANTVDSFGDEWTRLNQEFLSDVERKKIFEDYFFIFPWNVLPRNAEGFDMGCGSGRWAKLVAPHVGVLNCIDASDQALDVARRSLADHANVRFYHASANATSLPLASQDFGYSLGVLHHVPDTAAAMKACVDLLKPGAPFLIYLYYRFDNRPVWFRAVWKASDLIRSFIRHLPPQIKSIITDTIAVAIYWPFARLTSFLRKIDFDTALIPLSYYHDKTFYTMRTDSRDRFGTPLERRFTRDEIRKMMEASGLQDIHFSDRRPYWCSIGFKI